VEYHHDGKIDKTLKSEIDYQRLTKRWERNKVAILPNTWNLNVRQ